MKTFYIETLGCSKNQVDSEKMIYLLTDKGFIPTENPEDAEIVIVNTCSFIKKAKEEAIEFILEFLKYKKNGKCKIFIAAGCLAQLYSKELEKEIPEIDFIFGVGDISKITDVINSKQKIVKPDISKDLTLKRKLLGFPGSAYLKISDGCSNFCTYCLIPKIRGNIRSRSIESILSEVEFLKNNNIKEIILIAQDTANYGIDIYNKKSLGKLVNEISKLLSADDWLRILYMHPDHIDDALIKELSLSNNFIPYFDIPFQSGSNKILSSMNRKNSALQNENLIKKIRNNFNDTVIRSTFITGFPDENESDFKDTLKFIEKIQIEWIGAFSYSKEPDTIAGKIKNQIKEKIKAERMNKILELSEKISSGRLKRFLETKQKILIEERVENETLYLGRFWGQAPEVDGLTVVESGSAEPGNFYETKIKKLNEKDFYAL